MIPTIFGFLKNVVGRALGTRPLDKLIDMLEPGESRLSWAYVLALLLRLGFIVGIFWIAQYFGVPVEKVIEVAIKLLGVDIGN